MKTAVVAAITLCAGLWLESEAERVLPSRPASAREQALRALRPSFDFVHLGCVTGLPMVVLADEALIRGVHEGDLSALETIYRTSESVVFNLARRLCGSDAEADDVLQDTFVEVGRSLGKYRGEGALASWLKRICVTKALMRLRHNDRFADVAIGDHASHEVFGGRRDLEAALAQISPITRAVLWLHDVEGYTHEEIGALLNKSVSFSKSQLSRGHARLRELLSAKDDQ